MPQFDESFLSDCALADRWHFYSYTLKQTPHHHHQHNYSYHHDNDDNDHQRAPWMPRDNNNNSGHTLHNIKFQRRCRHKKMPRLAASLSMPVMPMSQDSIPNAVAGEHGSISSPNTPGGGAIGGGCSSSSNNSINSGSYASASSVPVACTPPPPTHQNQNQHQHQYQGGGRAGGGVPPAPPSAVHGNPSGSSGHKNSLKGTKLARRARSFKDDLIEKISLMRTTNNTLGRSHSPHSPRTKHGAGVKPPPSNEEVQRSTQTLETHVKDISNALKHFRDVILKKKLEVLPGNGTVILETIASMYSVIQTYTPLNENSAIMSSATQQVYQSLGKLIKLCDEVMLSDESGECPSLSNDNVREVIDLLEDAVRNLVTLAQGKLKEQDQCAFRYSGASGLGGIGAAAEIMGAVTASSTNAGSGGILPVGGVPGTGITGVASMRISAVDNAAVGQRTSLPDIALSPKERAILEHRNVNPMRGSHSTESILRDTSPPPKPPLPNRASNPPPLPPKRRSQPQAPPGGSSSSTSTSNQASPLPYAQSHNISLNSDLDCSSNISLLNYGVDRLSVRSRSPDENSQCSFDSALNHSREEEDPQQQQQQLKQTVKLMEEDADKMISYNAAGSASAAAQEMVMAQAPSNAQTLLPGTGVPGPGPGASGAGAGAGGGGETNTELRTATAVLTNNRHSNESGFVSMKSFRTSTQSVSKRSSDYSVQSSAKSSSSNSEIAISISESASATASAASSEYQQISQSVSHSSQRSQHQQLISSSCSSSMTTTTMSSYSSGDQQEQAATTEAAAPALPPKLTTPVATVTATATTTHQRTLTHHESSTLDELDWSQGAASSSSSSAAEVAELRQLSPHHHHQQQLHQWYSKHHSLIEAPRSAPHHLAGSCSAFDQRHLEEPPPLPIKRKNILAYMEVCSAPTRIEQHRHTMHACNISRNISHSQTMNIMPMSKELSPELETPPALPPKNYKQRKPTPSLQPIIVTTPPPSPKPTLGENGSSGGCGGGGSGRPDSRMATVCEEHNDSLVLDNNENVNVSSGDGDGDGEGEGQTFYCHSHQLPDEPVAAQTLADTDQQQQQPISTPKLIDEDQESRVAPEYEAEKQQEQQQQQDAGEVETLINMLEEVNITRYLILKKKEEDGPEVKGGYIDALIVHASRVQKVADNGRHPHPQQAKRKHVKHPRNHRTPPHSSCVCHSVSVHSTRAAFSEAFITTFRTFIQPIDVIEKLTHRYTYFFCQVQDNKQKAAKETFSLLVRVVNDLTSTDLTSQLLSLLVEFVYQLVCSGQLYLAKLLRNKFVEKVTLYKEPKVYGFVGELELGGTITSSGAAGGGGGGGVGGLSGNSSSSMSSGSSNQPSLLDLKSLDIAEQMTLLDAELFQKIEIPEVLLFAKDQCEEKSPNLNKFTEHFNKMSYWARSKILRLHDAKEREKHVNKFIKIMKHLRKMNNYNSYLALLSALDSGPIRRLEWQKSITEEVRSFCALIDSSSSFRAYRQALAETNPPCIPYIGLVLQDLTFVHVGNQDYLSKGVINFSKRWQQYNIIVNMKRFKKCAYPFRRNERVIRFFENFKDFMGEEEMWQISEKIKPRGRRPQNY
ncbi:guanine nucleotide-releasing factor 2 isoform X2 [Drosophila pseudoobscura]|uniref:CRK SH3-binding GNRP n=1 Tax=Drosophila pseudoobscura pseudoobscura TaxID=46245 RepID=A0A6I8VH59_DROPS|nr:guanine nucleotide-releasing factor 2 isoform X2 [Drosophila pseudoobscura]